MEDYQIIELFFKRKETAIEQLSQKYGKLCLKISENILKSHQDAQECVNDTYLAVWNTIPPKRPNPLPAYVCRIVRNISVKKYHENTAIKRNSFYDAALDELEETIPAAATVEEEAAVNELVNAINRSLASISKRNRIIFVRRYWFADSIKDIAEMFQTSEHNISVCLSRTRKMLKKNLEKEGFAI